LTDIPGVGKAIAEKIDELLNWQAGVPEKLNRGARAWGELQVPDLGPKNRPVLAPGRRG
jgi:hypothetical protein